MSNRANRAAQFNPFDSLKGLNEALRKKEEELSRVKKRELSEEEQVQITAVLTTLVRRQKISITHYDKGHYVSCDGIVTDINLPYRFICVGQKKILFEDIAEIRFV